MAIVYVHVYDCANIWSSIKDIKGGPISYLSWQSMNAD